MQVGHAHTVNFHLVAPHFVPLAATRAFIRITDPSAGAPLVPLCSAAQRSVGTQRGGVQARVCGARLRSCWRCNASGR